MIKIEVGYRMKMWEVKAEIGKKEYKWHFCDLKSISEGKIIVLRENWFDLFLWCVKKRGAQSFTIKSLISPEGEEVSGQNILLILLTFEDLPMGFLIRILEKTGELIAIWPKEFAEAAKRDLPTLKTLVTKMIAVPEKLSDIVIASTSPLQEFKEDVEYIT